MPGYEVATIAVGVLTGTSILTAKDERRQQWGPEPVVCTCSALEASYQILCSDSG